MKKPKKILAQGTHQQAYKFRFYPSMVQAQSLAQTFGCARFVFNHTLDYSIKNYKSRNYTIVDDFGDLIQLDNTDYKSVGSVDRINYINELKIVNPWLKEVSSIVLQQSNRDLNTSYDRFFTHKSGFPSFKKMGNRNSFRITGKNSIHFDEHGNYTLPKMKHHLDIKFSRDFDRTQVSSITVSREPSGHYYISFLSIGKNKKIKPIYKKTGFDGGFKTTFVSFNGTNFVEKNIPNLTSIVAKIKHLQKEMSRKVIRSNNRHKARIQLAKAYETKSNIIKDFQHKLTTQLVNENQVIIGEDLDLAQMKLKKNLDTIKDKTIRQCIQHVSLGEMYRQIDYKSAWQNKTFLRADQYFPSSKLCSQPGCGYIHHDLQLSDRSWTCPDCHTTHDRDQNAAVNLYHYDEKYAQQVMKEVLAYHQQKKLLTQQINPESAVGMTVYACGGDVSLSSQCELSSPF